MASWMVHLRIADKLLDKIPGLSPIDFIIGSMAPDSGIPNEDRTNFTPSTKISHFKKDSRKASPEAFARKYFTLSQQKSYTAQQHAFYLGYLCHLLTDNLWSEQIARPCFQKYVGDGPPWFGPKVTEIKADWYDLDFKYLRDHPGFRAFRVYLGTVGFLNQYMDEFTSDAFENRRQYITSFYLQNNNNIDRNYTYLTEDEMNTFTESAVREILSQLDFFTDISKNL